jgi:cephalosporin-C deacetylase-like acetyl esterase
MAQGGFDPTEIWDLAEIQDPGTLHAEVVDGPKQVKEMGVPLDVFQVKFDSIDRGAGPIRIHGFVAVPSGHRPGTLPAIIYGHGAGDKGDETIARELAAQNRAAAISFSGPGQGRSTGPSSTAVNWLNTVPDIRDCWLYQYAYSAMRAVTYMATLPQVDARRTGMTGISAGGLITWIVNGVDDRLAAALPLMATGDWPRSLQAGSWFLAFPLGDAGLSADSPQAQAFQRYLDPIHYADRQHAPVLLMNGAQDEFFPIDTTRSTFEAVRAPEKRLEIIYDWDHGYFAGSTGLHNSYNNLFAALNRVLGDSRAWFDWHTADGPALPPTPEVSARQTGGYSVFTVAPEFVNDAAAVQLIYSRDNAYSFKRLPLRRQPDGSYSGRLVGTVVNAVYFVEVQWPGPLFLTSIPELPEGFVPHIRPPS